MRFMIVHPLKPGTTREDIEQMQRASQTDPQIKGYRSFLNLSEGKGFCVFDAPSQQRLVSWLEEHSLPYESITEVELEGEYGRWVELPTPAHATSGR